MKYGIREICDVVLKAKSKQKIGNKVFYKDEPVIYFDSLKTSSLEGAATTVYAQGGRGNSRLVAWEGERTVTFTMEDALISTYGLAILTGAGIVESNKEKVIEQSLFKYSFSPSASNLITTFSLEPVQSFCLDDYFSIHENDWDSSVEMSKVKKGKVTALELYVQEEDENTGELTSKLINSNILASYPIKFDNCIVEWDEPEEEGEYIEGQWWQPKFDSEPIILPIKQEYYIEVETSLAEGTGELYYNGQPASVFAIVEPYTETIVPANTIQVHQTENTAKFNYNSTKQEVVITPKKTPSTHDSASIIYVMPLNNGEIYTEPYYGYVENGNVVVKTRTDKGYTADLTKFAEADSVMLDYYIDIDSGVQQIEITPDKFGGNYYLEASTLFRDTNGVDMPAEFIIPNCKIQSNFTFTMASSGDPTTFTFTLDAFPDYTRFDKTKKVLSVIQVITDSEEDKSKVRKSTDSSRTEFK